MNPCALPMGVSALASAIACHVPNDEELALMAAAFTQLGDTLETILAQRALCAQAQPPCCRQGTASAAAEPDSAEESPVITL